LKLKPFYPDAHNNLGVALWRLGKLELAVIEFRETIRQRPSPGVYENVGLLLEQMGDPEAKSFLQKADAMRRRKPSTISP